jgi:signal transduction histidine kinase/CheY-like chemotaxis protein
VRYPEYLDILNQVYATGEARAVVEWPIRNEAGEVTRYFDYICCPWREEDGVVAGVMTLAVDVTEQVRGRNAMKAAEERLRETARLESLGVLAGGIAHDFNNLLVGIIGNASMALESLPASHPVHGMITGVLKAGERAATLTRQMLAYAGKGRFVIESVNLSALVEEMLPLIQGAIPKTVVLTTKFERSLPTVEADASQLHQVFMNLVINAAEACEEGPGRVEVVTSIQQVDEQYALTMFGSAELAPGLYVCLEVSDNGAGMDDATKARIFDPFFTTKFTGRGLGLSAVVGIIRAHKGAIKVYSEPGRGSIFRVLLPAEPAMAMESGKEETNGLASSHRPGTVLVVDDEEVVRVMARAALEQLGFGVIEASNGREALERFAERRGDIDLVILDLTMPLMSGEETLRKLRALDPEVMVILSSGFNESDATRHFKGDRLAGFLQKPYTLTRLNERVTAALGSRN